MKRYFEKKRNNQERHKYNARAKVADKRLRIKGRFVTRVQAFEILGLSKEDLLDSYEIQKLLTEHADLESSSMQMNSVVTDAKGTSRIKVSNF